MNVILTPRQREIVRLLILGYTSKEIGAILGFQADDNGCCKLIGSRLRQARRKAYAMTNEQLIFNLCRRGYFQSPEWLESFPRIAALIIGLLLLFTTAQAAEYAVLAPGHTNLAPALGDAIQWRFFTEIEEFHIASTNWTIAVPSAPDTNGVVKYNDVLRWETNHEAKIIYKDTHGIIWTWTEAIGHDSGPIIATRPSIIPPPLPTNAIPAQLQLRKRR